MSRADRRSRGRTRVATSCRLRPRATCVIDECTRYQMAAALMHSLCASALGRSCASFIILRYMALCGDSFSFGPRYDRPKESIEQQQAASKSTVRPCSVVTSDLFGPGLVQLHIRYGRCCRRRPPERLLNDMPPNSSRMVPETSESVGAHCSGMRYTEPDFDLAKYLTN